MRFGSAKVACCVTDEHRTILSVDDAFSELVQRPRSELIGRDCLSFTDIKDLPRNDNLLSSLQLGGAPFAITKRYVHPDLSRVTVTNHVSAFSDGLGPARLLATCVTAMEEPAASRRRHTAAQLHAALSLAKRAFGSDLISAPVVEVLLRVYLAEVEGRATTAAEVCDAIGLPPTVGTRWLKVLVKRGEVEFEDGTVPGFSEAVRISAAALGKIEALLETLNQAGDQRGKPAT